MSKNTRTRILLVAVASLLLVTMAVGGTVAWLAAESDTVTNVFTTSDVNLKLEETTTDYKMVPGCDIEKNPLITVEAGSEPCYVFVKVTESTDPAFDTYMTYEMADGWLPLDDVDGVYYQTVGTVETGVVSETELQVLADNKVVVKDGITKAQMEALDAAGKNPTLTFVAYAVQQAELDVDAAWAAISDPDVDSTTSTTPEGYPAN